MLGAVEVIVQGVDITAEEITPLKWTGDHLHDWWLDEMPGYVGAQPQDRQVATLEEFRVALVVEEEGEDAYSLGIAENEDGSGASLNVS